MPQFAATINHIKDGVKGFTVAQAVKNIEGWEETLRDKDVPGAKAIVADLERLKKHLQADELDGEAIRKLVLKLGQETVRIAGKADGKKAEQIAELGEALTAAAEEADGADDAKSKGRGRASA